MNRIELENDEKILFHEKADVKQTNKQTLRYILAAVLLIIFWIIVVKSISINQRIDFSISMIIFALFIVSIVLIYGFIYNNLLKYKNRNNEYYVTNKRIILDNSKKGRICKDISDIERVGIYKEKNNYGDIVFNIYSESFYQSIKNSISFEGIRNPREIVNKIKEINENIQIYDDKPQGIMFKEK